MAILSILGLGTTVASLLATAGIGGIAIAFGAQTLVKDVVSGFFMLFEDEYSVGEYIDVDGEKGTVESISIRTTTIKKFTGELTTIPNGFNKQGSELFQGRPRCGHKYVCGVRLRYGESQCNYAGRGGRVSKRARQRY